MKPFTLFISDLHLCANRPDINHAFERFIQGPACDAEAVYILGDLFEYWAGDDDLNDPFNAWVQQQLSSLATQQTQLYLMRGNRDVLIGETLAQACAATLLTDPTLINLHGKPTLLCHGDALCTDDVEYMAHRQRVTNPAFQRQFLAKPLTERKAFIEALRAQSELTKQQYSDLSIMDVNADAVAELLRQHQYPQLIHGHTHQPACHQLEIDGHHCQRWVLADWHHLGSALRCDATGCRVFSW